MTIGKTKQEEITMSFGLYNPWIRDRHRGSDLRSDADSCARRAGSAVVEHRTGSSAILKPRQSSAPQ